MSQLKKVPDWLATMAVEAMHDTTAEKEIVRIAQEDPGEFYYREETGIPEIYKPIERVPEVSRELPPGATMERLRSNLEDVERIQHVLGYHINLFEQILLITAVLAIRC